MADNRVKIVITADGKDAKEAIQSLNKQLQSTGREAGKATRKAGKLEAAFAKTGRGVRDLSSGVFSLKGALAGLGIGIVVRDLFQAGAEAQRLQASFKAITGSATGAGREMAFIRSESERLGLSLLSTAKGYKTIAASAKGTTLEGQAVRDIFIGISEASTAMNLSSEQAEGALLALGQMISKGTVQAEELKGQLGERLPGAFQIAARAMGVSTQELNKMLEQGEILAEDLLPRLAKALHDEYGKAAMDAAHGAAQAWNRFETAVFDLKVQLGEGGFMEAATGALTDLSDVLKDEEMQKSLKGIAEGFGALTVSLGEVLPGAVDTGIGSLNKIVEWWRDLPEPLQGLLAGVAVGGKIGGKYGALFGGMAGLGFGAGAWHASEFQEQKDLAEIRTKDRAIMRGGGRRRGVALPPGTLEAEYLSQHATGGPPAPGSGGGAKGKAGWLSESKERMHLTADRFGGKLPGAARADRDKVADKALEAMIREAEKQAEQAIKIDGRIFAQKKKRLDAEYKELKKHVQDQQALDIWYAQESSEIEKERLESMRDKAKSFGEWRKYQRKLDTQDFLSEGEKQAREWLEMHQRMQRATEDFSRAIGDTLGDVLFDGMTGDLKTFEDYWESAWRGMAKTAADAVAEIATQKIVEPAVEWAIDAIFAKGGLYEVGRDGQKVVAHKGEMVVPAPLAAELRGRGDTFGDIQASLAGDWGGISGQMAQLGQSQFGAALGDAAKSMGAKTGAKALTAAMYGKLDPTPMIAGILNPASLMGFLGPVVGSTIQSGLAVPGMNNRFSFASIGSKLGSISSVLGASMMGIGLGGPIGVGVGMLGGMFGSVLGDLAGDAMDMRDLEGMLDAAEDAMGRQNAHQAIAALEGIFGSGSVRGFTEQLGFTMNPNSKAGMLWGVQPGETVVMKMGTKEAIDAQIASAIQSKVRAAIARSGIHASRDIMAMDPNKPATAPAQAELGRMVAANPSFFSFETRRAVNYDPGAGLNPSTGRATSKGYSSRAGLYGSVQGGSAGGDVGQASSDGWSQGGVVDRLYVPKGDHGFGALQLGEGIVSRDAMEMLGKINRQELAGIGGGGGPITIVLMVDGHQVAQAMIPNLLEASQQGQHVVHANGVREAEA